MNRRSLHTALAAAVAIVVLLCAAASGPGTLWISPPGGNTPLTPSSEPIEDTVVERPAKQAERGGEWPAWVGGVLRAAAVLLLVALLIGAGALATSGRLPRPRWWHFRAGAQGPINPLPEHDDPTIAIDVALARAALDGGTPRNGIVACWMQLEDDAAAAGLARLPSETPAEYVQRVVAASSVDPAPIGELAALYREARFSRHELGDAHRARALAALERVADGLPREAEVVA